MNEGGRKGGGMSKEYMEEGVEGRRRGRGRG